MKKEAYPVKPGDTVVIDAWKGNVFSYRFESHEEATRFFDLDITVSSGYRRLTVPDFATDLVIETNANYVVDVRDTTKDKLAENLRGLNKAIEANKKTLLALQTSPIKDDKAETEVRSDLSKLTNERDDFIRTHVESSRKYEHVEKD